MKNKKKFFIIGGSAISIILAVVLCIVLIPKHGEEKPTESEPTESSNSTVVIDEPVSETQSTETNSINEEVKIDDDGNGLLKPEAEDDTAEKSETTGEKAKEPNKVITEQPVSKEIPEQFKSAAVNRRHIAVVMQTITVKTLSTTHILRTLSLPAVPIAVPIAVIAFMRQTNGDIQNTRLPNAQSITKKKMTPRFVPAADLLIGRQTIPRDAFLTCRIQYASAAKRLRETPAIITEILNPQESD